MSSDPRWLLMKEIYFAAVSLQGEDRAQYLKEHCPDESMRGQVEKLLAESTMSATMPLFDSVPEGSTGAAEPMLGQGMLLGHYRIKQKLGAGGMGWVYEANDENLRRAVAIKVLPPGQDDPEHRRRLTREAQSASALNHPNIITVYEVGHESGIDFIAMERVHGLTLRNVIGPNGLDVKTSVRYAAQIADALAAAHDAQIVHRDLKPGNIMVTERGLVKVLDFGIAKQVLRTTGGGAGPTDLTLSHSGEVVGTLSYMSPEQAQGLAVDARSDIFSFGSLLYEMLSGHRAFQEQTVMSTLSAVVSKDPPLLHSLRPELPRTLERLVAKCLEKKPHDRWQHMSDVKLLLQDLAKDFELPEEQAPARAAPRPAWMAAAAGGLVVAALGGAGWYYSTRWAPPPPEPTVILRRVSSDAGLSTTPAMSRDGALIAFSSDRAGDGGLDIWVQQVNGREPLRLTSDAADDTDPDFSPDGSRIVFRSERSGGGIYVVPAFGGDALLLAAGGRQPKFSPDGRTIVYWVGRDASKFPDSSHVFTIDAAGGQPRRIDNGLSWARAAIWAPGGKRIVASGALPDDPVSDDWWALPFPIGAPESVDATRQIRKRVGSPILPVPLDWTADGRGLLFAANTGDAQNLWELPVSQSVKASGTPRRMTVGPGRQTRAAFARGPNALRTAFDDETLNVDVWELPFDTDGGGEPGPVRRLTEQISPDWAPSISVNGKELVYITGLFRNWSVRARSADGGKERTLVSSTDRIPFTSISGDGSRAFFTNLFEHDIFAIPVRGGIAEKVCPGCGMVTGVSYDGTQFVFEPSTDEDLLLFDTATKKKITLAKRPDPKSLIIDGRLSNDNQWVVFAHSNSSAGTTQIFIVPVNLDKPVPREQWIPITANTELARDPAWSPSSNVIYYTAERDGFRCIWGRKLNPRTKVPAGEPFAVRHFHSARQTIRNIGPQTNLVGLSVAKSRLVYAQAVVTGSIWLQEAALAK